MKTLLLICIWAITIPAMACSCAVIGTFKTQDDLRGYDFIALVNVSSLAPLDTTKKMFHLRKSGDIGIDILELFKGDKADVVYDENFENDCAFPLEKNVQWIFFGYKRDGKIYVNKCSYSIQYRTPEGYREWQYLSGIKQLELLRRIYGHAAAKMPEKEFYTDGKVEIEQSFKNGLLNGKRRIYYPDGKLWITEDFKNGERAGARNIYSKTGQLLKQTAYDKGYIKEITAYHDTAETAWYLHYQSSPGRLPLFAGDIKDSHVPLKQLDSLRNLKDWPKMVMYSYTFIDSGYSYHFYARDFLGRMERSAEKSWPTQTEITYEYEKNGAVEEYMKYNKKANKRTGYHNGTNGQHHIFDDDCNECASMFNKDDLMSAPEMVCVQ